MATLLDQIRGSLEKPATPEQTGAGLGQTSQLQTLLRAKTGKAAQPSSGPGISSLQEKSATRQAQLGADQLQQQGQMASSQLGAQQQDITQRQDIQKQQVAEQQKGIQQSYEQNATQLLNQLSRAGRELGTQKNVANLEQAGFNLRLSNEQYVANLKQAGAKARLDDGFSFKEQITREIFEDQTDLLKDSYAFENMIRADDRTFQKELANMDINYALDLAKNAQKAESTQAAIGGVGKTVTAATGGAKDLDLFKDKTGDANPEPVG